MNDPIVDRTVKRLYLPEYDPAEGRRVARAYAQWHLGDPDWADAIIDAYLMPESALETLNAEKETV